MEDVTKELNEKLKEVCESIDVDYNEYVVIRKDELDVYIEAINELAALEDYGEAMQSLYDEDDG